MVLVSSLATMKKPIYSKQASLSARSAVKQVARKRDSERLAAGVPVSQIQEENSALPESIFANAKISNLAEAVGR